MPKQSQNKSMKRVTAAVTGRIRPVKYRIRVSRSNDRGVAVNSVLPFSVTSTDPFGFYTGSILVNPALYTADGGGAVLKNFSEYRMDQGSFHWTPAVGTTTTGTLWVGYYDNPEIMLKATTGVYNTATMLALAKQSPHRSSGPIWVAQQLSLPLFRRRQRYSTDTTAVVTRADMDLSAHGVFIVAIEGCPYTSAVGHLSFEYSAQGYNLENQVLTGI